MTTPEKVDKILQSVARIETKLDHHAEKIADHSGRIGAMEKKWWTTLGAFVLSLGAYLRSMFS